MYSMPVEVRWAFFLFADFPKWMARRRSTLLTRSYHLTCMSAEFKLGLTLIFDYIEKRHGAI